MSALYDEDIYTWALQQAKALRKRSGNEVDWENVAEEIESLGKSQLSEAESRLFIICTHLLKWIYQPEQRSRSWEATLKIERYDLNAHLAQNPGLKPKRASAFKKAYRNARLQAGAETGLPDETFPDEPPFTLAQALDETWWG
jgi:hypothetical protein